MKIIKSVKALQKWSRDQKKKGHSIGLVPTMGALHAGHLSLAQKSAQKCDKTIMSIFVNPLQFGANEDLDSYPRRLKRDADLAESAGVDVIFAPTMDDMYDADHQTYIYNDPVQTMYCGHYRPGHFQGVLTVVAKLFFASLADYSYFGKKDFQQFWLIRKMVSDLNIDIKVVGCPTVREKSGLAMSSRNEYLQPSEIEAASVIYASMKEVRTKVKSGKLQSNTLRKWLQKNLASTGGEVQYAELASLDSLQPIKGKITENFVILVAVYFGKTRLIDNLVINLPK